MHTVSVIVGYERMNKRRLWTNMIFALIMLMVIVLANNVHQAWSLYVFEKMICINRSFFFFLPLSLCFSLLFRVLFPLLCLYNTHTDFTDKCSEERWICYYCACMVVISTIFFFFFDIYSCPVVLLFLLDWYHLLLKREELLFLFRWAIVINRIKNAINRENEEKKKKKERKKEENESNEKNGNVRRAVS